MQACCGLEKNPAAACLTMQEALAVSVGCVCTARTEQQIGVAGISLLLAT